MNQPIWYTKSEAFMLHQGRPFILLALALILILTGYFFIQTARGKVLLPAATWAVYMWLP